MGIFHGNDTIGNLVAHYPMLAHIFEKEGIDYCCGGKKTLDAVCQEKGLDRQAFTIMLEKSTALSEEDDVVDVTLISLTELVDHIEATHHAYVYTELPRLVGMLEKVVAVHQEKNPRLHQIRDAFFALSEELPHHMMKEEQILFPMVRQLDASEAVPLFHCGTLKNPIGQMESEHSDAGSALEKMRELTDDYIVPDWACPTYQALLHSFVAFEQDLHRHIHKENNVLFPRVIKMEHEKSE